MLPTTTVRLLPTARASPSPLPAGRVVHLPTIVLSSLTATAFRLPLNEHNAETVYCQSPAVQLSLVDAQEMSPEQIVTELMRAWLAYFSVARAPDYCRIAGYKVEQVYYDPVALRGPLDPQGDIMRVVRFAVRLIQVPNFWMGWAGEVDEQNWLHLTLSVAVFRRKTGYTMQFAYP